MAWLPEAAVMHLDPAILGLAGAGVIQLVVVAFWAGVLTARVKTLEDQMAPMVALAAGLAKVEAEIRMLNQSISWLRQPAMRRAAESPA
jgi:hypothetical protein